MALGRWVIKTPWRRALSVRARPASGPAHPHHPGWHWAHRGTIRAGLPYSARARPTRWRWPPESRPPASPMGCRSPWGSAKSSHANPLRCGNHLVGVHLAKAGNVFLQCCRQTAPHLAAGNPNRAQLGAIPAIEGKTSSSTSPLTSGQMPMRHTRARVDCPNPRAEHHGHRAHGGLQVNAFEDGLGAPHRVGKHTAQRDRPWGATRASAASRSGCKSSSVCKRSNAWRALRKSAPGAHHLVNGGQGARHQHVGGNRGACGELAIHHQQCPCRQGKRFAGNSAPIC